MLSRANAYDDDPYLTVSSCYLELMPMMITPI